MITSLIRQVSFRQFTFRKETGSFHTINSCPMMMMTSDETDYDGEKKKMPLKATTQSCNTATIPEDRIDFSCDKMLWWTWIRTAQRRPSGPKMERLPAVAHAFMKRQTFWPSLYHFSPPVLLFRSPRIPLHLRSHSDNQGKIKMGKGFLAKDFLIKQLDLDTLGFFFFSKWLTCLFAKTYHDWKPVIMLVIVSKKMCPWLWRVCKLLPTITTN